MIILHFDIKRQFTYELFHIYFTPLNSSREIWTQQIDLAPNVWLHSSAGRASHRYRGGDGFKSRWIPDFFRLLSNCLNWKLLRWSFFTLIYHRSSHMNYFIYTSPQNGFCRYICANRVTLWAASYSACVVYTKTIIHLSVGKSGGYLPPVRWIIVNYFVVRCTLIRAISNWASKTKTKVIMANHKEHRWYRGPIRNKIHMQKKKPCKSCVLAWASCV